MNKTAVVFGATGLVGKNLVYELIENDSFLKIIVVLRNHLPIKHSKLEQLKTDDFSKLEQFSAKLNADVYFCCIGTTIKKAGSQEAFRRVDHDIPVTIANLAESLHIPALIVVSSIGANAGSGNFYLRTKGEMENAVKSAYTGNLKIIRPSLLLGNRSEFRFGEKIGVYVMKVIGILMVGPLKKYKGVRAVDVARVMIKVMNEPINREIIESDTIHNLAPEKK